jgi:hypothetical protein
MTTEQIPKHMQSTWVKAESMQLQLLHALHEEFARDIPQTCCSNLDSFVKRLVESANLLDSTLTIKKRLFT